LYYQYHKGSFQLIYVNKEKRNEMVTNQDENVRRIVEEELQKTEERLKVYVEKQMSSLGSKLANTCKNPYWLILSRIELVVLSVSQRQFSTYLCKYNSS
jgi:3'-phosphoadenosine 5'-phosphosulfate (PAPS) 3'-phosphatase